MKFFLALLFLFFLIMTNTENVSATKKQSTPTKEILPPFNQLLNETTLNSFQWILPTKPTIVQGQNFYFITDTGEFLFFQIAHSYLQVYSLVQASCRYYSKSDGMNIFETRNFKPSEWSMYKSSRSSKDSDFVSNHVGPFKVIFREHPIPGFNISFESPKLSMSLYLDLVSTPLTVRDGVVEFISSKANGTFLFKFAPQFVFSGTIGFGSNPNRSISGLASLNSMTQLVEPHLTSSRWGFFYFVANGTERISLTLLHFTTTALFHSKELSQGILTMGGNVSGLSLNNSVSFINPTLSEKSGGYMLPTAIKLTLDGTGPDGPSDIWHAEVEIPLITCMDRIDLLGYLPFLVRKVIQAFISKPYCFQWFDEVTLHLTKAGNSYTFTGKIFSELFCLS